MPISDSDPENKSKRPILSANVTAIMKHVEAAIDTAMSLNKYLIKVPYAKPNALKAYISKWKSTYRKDWWGAFEMWPDFEHKVLEIRFKKAKYEVKIDFGFDGILFDDELNIDGIISRVVGLTDKQSKFRVSQLKESEKNSLRQLKADFYIEEVGDHFIFTPRLNREDASGLQSTLSSGESARFKQATPIKLIASSAEEETKQPEKKEEKDPYGF